MSLAPSPCVGESLTLFDQPSTLLNPSLIQSIWKYLRKKKLPLPYNQRISSRNVCGAILLVSVIFTPFPCPGWKMNKRRRQNKNWWKHSTEECELSSALKTISNFYSNNFLLSFSDFPVSFPIFKVYKLFESNLHILNFFSVYHKEMHAGKQNKYVIQPFLGFHDIPCCFH